MTHSSPVSVRPCPFCGNELYRSPAQHNPKAYCVTEDCYGKRMSVVNLDDPVIVAMWNARVPAQGTREAALEAAAIDFIAKVDRGEARSKDSYAAFKAAIATPPQPAPADRGAGEAIFAECAAIALEHVGATKMPSYDEACRDIAAAIQTRASNRKVMDALVPTAPQTAQPAQRALAALEKAREYVANFLYTAGSHAYLKQCNLLIEIDAALSRPNREGK